MIWLRICAVYLISSFSGCITTNPAIVPKEQYNQDLLIIERDRIFAVYDDNIPKNIILAYEKIYGDTFDIAKNYLQYNKETENPTYDGFWIWLMKNVWYINIFSDGDKFGIGEYLVNHRYSHSAYQDVKKNYELLLKLGESEK